MAWSRQYGKRDLAGGVRSGAMPQGVRPANYGLLVSYRFRKRWNVVATEQLHLGILKVDSVRPEFQADYGDYPDMFERLLTRADANVVVSVFDAQHGELPQPTDCDGFLITGSRDSVYDDLPWIPPLVALLGQLREQRVKVAGICFGHQLLAHFFGGRVGAAQAGWAVGVHSADIVRQPSWLDDGGVEGGSASLALLSSHKDQVLELPRDAEIYATNAFCPIAGFTVGEHTLTIQGHPEFTKDYSRALMGFRRELLGENVHQEGVASLEQEVEQDKMGRWLINFFRGETAPQ